jgi:transglutaminase-like putative cysteine protease
MKRGVVSRKGIVVSSAPLEVSIGDSRVAPAWRARAGLAARGAPGRPPCRIAGDSGSPRPRQRAAPARRLVPAEPKRLHVTHRTTYRYDRAVERSTPPASSPSTTACSAFKPRALGQRRRRHSRKFDDVFGNRVKRIALDTPFTELEIVAKSVVDPLRRRPLGFAAARKRTTIPLVWMPGSTTCSSRSCCPASCPESQLVELAHYAMSFVERNDYDLLDTLLDLNRSIFREYAYRPGRPRSHDALRRVREAPGRLSDFANLFIALARLLGVPARYVCGYVFTGPQHARPDGEASHAWVQVYLPEVGWRGFDPTNGTVTQTEHVRVSVGRSYVDATPTGDALRRRRWQALEVEVRVDEEPMPPG